MRIDELIPGMDDVKMTVRVLSLSEPEERVTRRGPHRVVRGEVEDATGKIKLAVWDERIDDLAQVGVDDTIEITNGFVSSFKGVKEVNVGRLGKIRKVG